MEAGGFQVKVVRKRIRNINLYVKPPDGRVEVSAPYGAGDAAIAAFVCRKAAWIRSKQAALRERVPRPPRQWVSGESFFLWGREYLLRVAEGNWSLRFSGSEAFFTVKPGSTAEQREAWIREWYRDRLVRQAEILLPAWSERTGLVPASWQTKFMRTRWGTCNTVTRKIWLNPRLALKPPECLDYVILHELAHLRVRDHGPDFRAILDRYMPAWKDIRRRLNSSGMEL